MPARRRPFFTSYACARASAASALIRPLPQRWDDAGTRRVTGLAEFPTPHRRPLAPGQGRVGIHMDDQTARHVAETDAWFRQSARRNATRSALSWSVKRAWNRVS